MTFPVVGLLGPAGSGKDLVAEWLARERGYGVASLADPMKRFVYHCFGFSSADLWGPSRNREKVIEVSDSWWHAAFMQLHGAAAELRREVIPLQDFKAWTALVSWMVDLHRAHPRSISPRIVLQTLGTEWGRAQSPTLWLNFLHRKVVPRLAIRQRYLREGGFSRVDTETYEGVVVPDHRFANEVQETQSRGGRVYRLRRLALEPREVGIAGHQSEAEQRGLPDLVFDAVLEFGEFADLAAMPAALERAFELAASCPKGEVISVRP